MQPAIEIWGDRELIEDFVNSDSVIARHGEKLLDTLGAFGVDMVKAYTIGKGAIDTGEFLHGIHYKVLRDIDGMVATIAPSEEADKYAAPLEYGSRPHTPPVDALQGWADRHGIPVWAVVRKIQREGTEPRWMWRDAFKDLDRRADIEIVRWTKRLVMDL